MQVETTFIKNLRHTHAQTHAHTHTHTHTHIPNLQHGYNPTDKTNMSWPRKI